MITLYKAEHDCPEEFRGERVTISENAESVIITTYKHLLNGSFELVSCQTLKAIWSVARWCDEFIEAGYAVQE